MEFFHLRAGEEFIRLGQVLKAAGFVENGGQAKEVIQDGFVSVNGEVETRRVVNCIRTTLYLTKKMS